MGNINLLNESLEKRWRWRFFIKCSLVSFFSNVIEWYKSNITKVDDLVNFSLEYQSAGKVNLKFPVLKLLNRK